MLDTPTHRFLVVASAHLVENYARPEDYGKCHVLAGHSRFVLRLLEFGTELGELILKLLAGEGVVGRLGGGDRFISYASGKQQCAEEQECEMPHSDSSRRKFADIVTRRGRDMLHPLSPFVLISILYTLSGRRYQMITSLISPLSRCAMLPALAFVAAASFADEAIQSKTHECEDSKLQVEVAAPADGVMEVRVDDLVARISVGGGILAGGGPFSVSLQDSSWTSQTSARTAGKALEAACNLLARRSKQNTPSEDELSEELSAMFAGLDG